MRISCVGLPARTSVSWQLPNTYVFVPVIRLMSLPMVNPLRMARLERKNRKVLWWNGPKRPTVKVYYFRGHPPSLSGNTASAYGPSGSCLIIDSVENGRFAQNPKKVAAAHPTRRGDAQAIWYRRGADGSVEGRVPELALHPDGSRDGLSGVIRQTDGFSALVSGRTAGQGRNGLFVQIRKATELIRSSQVTTESPTCHVPSSGQLGTAKPK